MKTAYTRGEWIAREPSAGVAVVEAELDGQVLREICHCFVDDEDSGEDLANLALITSASKLLEASAASLPYIQHAGHCRIMQERACSCHVATLRAAIAKARRDA